MMRERASQQMVLISLSPPEMYLSGYPADDLVLRGDFMSAIAEAVSRLAPDRRWRPCNYCRRSSVTVTSFIIAPLFWMKGKF